MKINKLVKEMDKVLGRSFLTDIKCFFGFHKIISVNHFEDKKEGKRVFIFDFLKCNYCGKKI